MSFDFFGIIFDFWDNVMLPFGSNAYNWLFTPVIIGDYEFIPFYLLGGSLFFVLLVLWLINKIIG